MKKVIFYLALLCISISHNSYADTNAQEVNMKLKCKFKDDYRLISIDVKKVDFSNGKGNPKWGTMSDIELRRVNNNYMDKLESLVSEKNKNKSSGDLVLSENNKIGFVVDEKISNNDILYIYELRVDTLNIKRTAYKLFSNNGLSINSETSLCTRE